MPVYEAHGQYKLELISNILVIDAKGPFNKELMTDYHKNLKELIDEVQGKPWAVVLYLHGNSVMTPDAEEELRKAVEWRKSIGLSCVALITADCTPLSARQFSAFYKGMSVECQAFGSKEQAMDWARQVKNLAC